MFLDNTQRRSTVGRTLLDEWSARRRDLYLTTHDTHNRQISMPPVGFELTISAGERPQAGRLLRSWVRIPTGGMDVCLLWVLCVVRQRSLRRADHSCKGVLPNVVRRSVRFRNLVNEEAMTRVGSQRNRNKKRLVIVSTLKLLLLLLILFVFVNRSLPTYYFCLR